jgi:preprotein translocase subunit SecG
MIILVTSVHILVSLGLIVVVLLQTGKGTGMGAAFGGGASTTVFGSSGAGNFLTRMTTGMAIVFMLTCLTLGYFAEQGPVSSIFDSVTPQTQTGGAATPANAPAANVPATGSPVKPSEAPASP